MEPDEEPNNATVRDLTIKKEEGQEEEEVKEDCRMTLSRAITSRESDGPTMIRLPEIISQESLYKEGMTAQHVRMAITLLEEARGCAEYQTSNRGQGRGR